MARRARRRRLPTLSVAVLVALAAASVATAVDHGTACAAEPETTEGIDISHWQGEIDWTQVAGADKAFAIMKATEDIDYIDPTYGLNRARADAGRVLVGAYHYAQPEHGPGDAVGAGRPLPRRRRGIATGDLPPMLDLEEHNGLTDGADGGLGAGDFLERIHERTGVRGSGLHLAVVVEPVRGRHRLVRHERLSRRSRSPTGPTGLERRPCRRGTGPGFGWTFWQYTSNGAVAGITGRVDLDRFNGTDLSSAS